MFRRCMLSLFLISSSQGATHQLSPPIGTPTVALNAAALPTSFANVTNAQDPVTVLQIHQTLSLYPFLIDGKQFDHLDLVFHENVWANYSGLGAFQPLSTLEVVLRNALAPVNTQHALATQLIQIHEGGTTARSATYYTATHFGTGPFYGQGLWAWGTYEDNWVKNLTTGQWRIIERTSTFAVSTDLFILLQGVRGTERPYLRDRFADHYVDRVL
ncbi:hypothetical protein MMC22_010563 [Lobaria immixta]|nr:hypothetical protein [Lobaria immixta]